MKNRGAITLVFDDGYKSVYEEVLPLLRQYKVRAVFAVPLNTPENTLAGETITSYKEWLACAARDGHEIAAHGITHRDLTTLSEIELHEELLGPAEALQATTLVYPGGAHDDRIIHAAKKYYRSGRTVLYGLNERFPKDPMRLKTINFTKRNFSVLRANLRALQALLQNKWLIETYHMVSKKTSTLNHSVLLDDLNAHLDFITSLPIKIGTIGDIL